MMTPNASRFLGPAAFVTGLAALAWVAIGALGTHPIALLVTLVMAAFFVAGARELQAFQRGSRALKAAADAPPADAAAYETWLTALPAPLPGAVRQRIDLGGRGALPGPALAPTLTGLLVLLGMLGTFLGMVATLHGTGLALEQVTGMEALRDALSAPVKGLGLAFGTSVAGVATSAMLGLMMALARRERAEAVQALDRQIGTVLRPFSAAHRAALQHDDTVRALQRQADALPVMVTTLVDTVVTPLMDRLHTMMTDLQRQQEAAQQRMLESEQRAQQRLLDGEHRAQQRLSEGEQRTQQRLIEGEQRTHQRLIDGQAQFHSRTEAAFDALATSVERSLQESLADGARQAHDRLQPLLESTMGGLAREATALHGHLADTARQQVDAVTARLAEQGSAQAAQWARLLDDHHRLQQGHAEHLRSALTGFTAAFEARAGAMVDTLAAQLADQQQGRAAAWAEQDAGRLVAWRDTVATMATELRDAWAAAGEQTSAQNRQVCETLAETARAITDITQAQARTTVEEIGRLMQAAAEAPRAAAEVIGELRERLTDAMARDDATLRERERVLETLATLLSAVNRAATEQRDAIDALVGTASSLLRQAGERLQSQADHHGAALTEAATRTQAGAVEMASLGEAFGFAVQRFGEGSEALVAHLQRIEAALSKTLARSDDQLNYYVAQAREVIDLSLSSQKQVIEDLQALARREAA